MMLRLIAAVLACASLTVAERSLSAVTTSSQNANVSISFVPAGGKGSAPLPLNDSRIVPTGGAEQVGTPLEQIT